MDGTELISFFFRNLAEEMTLGDPVLPEARRKEVQLSLIVCLDRIVPFLTQSLRDAVARFSQDKARPVLLVCQAILEALHALLEWMPAKYVFESGLVADLCADLVQSDLFEHLCDCLGSVASRKASTIDLIYTNQLLSLWSSILTWCSSLQNAAPFAKQAEYLDRLVKILDRLGRNHLEILLDKKWEQARTQLLSTMVQLFSTNFQKTTIVVLELWVHMLRHHGAALIPQQVKADLMTELLRRVCFRMMKIDASEFEEQDFESQDEYNQFFSNLRGALLHLIELLVEMDTTLCFAVARMRYEQLLALEKPTDKLNKDGWVSYRTTRFLELEAVGALLEGLFRAKSDSDKFKTDKQLWETTEGLLRLLLNWQTEDPLLQTRRAHALAMFGPVLLGSQACFQATIEALMAGVRFRPQMYANRAYTELPEDLKACRRRSIVSLVALARRQDLVVGFFLPLFPQLVSGVLSMLQQKLIAQVEKIALFEFLVLISQSLASSAEQQSFLQNILTEPLTNWTGEQMNRLMEWKGVGQQQQQGQQEPFMQLIGMTAEDQQTLSNAQKLPPSHRTATREMRSQIRFILHTFMSVFKPLFVSPNTVTAARAPKQSEAAQIAATQLLPLILPNVVKLLAHLYSVRSPQIRSQLPQAMLGLLAPTADQILNPSASAQATVSVPPPTFYHLVWDVRRWMDRVLDSAMTIMMLAAKSGQAYYEGLARPDLHGLYIQTLYGSLPYMHLREVRTLLDKYLQSIFNLCPPQLYAGVFVGQDANGQACNTLANIFTALLQRLQQNWARVSAAKQSGGRSAGGDSLEDEIHEESELRELSRSIPEVLSRTVELQYNELHTRHTAAVAAEQKTGPKNNNEQREKELRQQETQLLSQAPFCQFLFTQTPVLTALMNMLNFLVTCPDSASSVRAVRLLHRLLPVGIASKSQQAVQLYSTAFQAGLTALASGTQQFLDTVESEVTAMMKDIYVALVLSGISASPRQSLLSLTSDQTIVSSLEAVLGVLCSEKKYRNAMRSCLKKLIKAPRIAGQQSVLSGQNGVAAAALTNPLDLLQTNSNAGTSGRVGPIANLQQPLNLPPKPVDPNAVADTSFAGSNLFDGDM
jgi:hypothetical protein